METPYRFRAIDYTNGGTLIKGGVKLCHVDTDYCKRWIHARVRWPSEQPGGWHLHRETTDEYCRHIVSEELVLKASGRGKWVRRSRNNHYLDAEVNALAAALSLNAHKLGPSNDAAPEPKVDEAGQVPRQPERFRRRELF